MIQLASMFYGYKGGSFALPYLDRQAILESMERGGASYLREAPRTGFTVERATTESAKLRADTPDLTTATQGPTVTRFISEQEFEGGVLAVGSDSFVARLLDLTNGGPDEEVQISFDEISPDDIPLITAGALFSWNIGLVERARQRTRVSEIRFRRTFSWSQRAIEQVQVATEHIKDALSWG